MIRLISAIADIADLNESDKDEELSENNSAEDLFEEALSDNSSGVQLIDMGTSVLWADRNLGASEPENDGDYYCWGQHYPMGHKKDIPLVEDIKDNPEYDVARKALGKGWSIPSYKDWQELMRVCNVTRTKCGFIVKSRKTGETLLFPDSYILSSEDFSLISQTSLWTSTCLPFDTPYYPRVHIVRFEKIDNHMCFDIRDPRVGLNIRPVYTPQRYKKKRTQ